MTDAGLNEAVAPAGTPLALSETVCADPLVTAVAIVEVALPFCVAETALGLAVIEKSSGGGAAPHPGSLNDRINYVRDSLILGASYFPHPAWRIWPSVSTSLLAG